MKKKFALATVAASSQARHLNAGQKSPTMTFLSRRSPRLLIYVFSSHQNEFISILSVSLIEKYYAYKKYQEKKSRDCHDLLILL